MARKDLFSSLFFILLSLYICCESLGLGFGSFAKPGPGFLPFLLGLTFGLLSVSVFVGTLVAGGLRERASNEVITWFPLLLTFGSLVGFTLLLKTLGIGLTTLLFLGFLLRTVGKKSWTVTVLLSLCVTSGTYIVFQLLLKSQLPLGPLGF